jgi:hypothetical protein
VSWIPITSIGTIVLLSAAPVLSPNQDRIWGKENVQYDKEPGGLFAYFSFAKCSDLLV